MSEQLHGSAVVDPAHPGQGVLIIGPSGSGKSALALQLMAFGCQLVADDLVEIGADDGKLRARNPSRLSGIEARGIGPLAARPSGPAGITLVVDMGHVETERLPQLRSVELCGVTLPLVHKCEVTHFPAAILQYMRCGRLA